MLNIFQKKKLINFMSQAPHLGRLICSSKFKSQHKNHEVRNSDKDCVSYSYLFKASLHQFKRVNKTFLLKNSFNSFNICRQLPWMQRKIYKTNGLSSERINKYLQTTYKTAAVSTIGS